MSRRPRPHQLAGIVAIGGFVLAAVLSVVLLVRSSGRDLLTWVELVSALFAAGVVAFALARTRPSGGRGPDQG